MKRSSIHFTFALAVVILAAPPLLAQAPLPATSAPSYAPAELDRIVSPIALYPDPLLAQVLAASTYASGIPDAARWADEHRNLTGTGLTDAIAEDRLPWDPSVQALLPFPAVLTMMSGDMPWTEELGNAFLAQHADDAKAPRARGSRDAVASVLTTRDEIARLQQELARMREELAKREGDLARVRQEAERLRADLERLKQIDLQLEKRK